jgi:hypothetical protein
MEFQQAWCGRCYRPLDDNEFHIAWPMDEDGVDVGDNEDETRFVKAQNGDNLVTLFQCDNVAFAI